jgi:hypothetical protein
MQGLPDRVNMVGDPCREKRIRQPGLRRAHFPLREKCLERLYRRGPECPSARKPASIP